MAAVQSHPSSSPLREDLLVYSVHSSSPEKNIVPLPGTLKGVCSDLGKYQTELTSEVSVVPFSSCEQCGQKELANLGTELPEGLIIWVTEGKSVLAFIVVPPKQLKMTSRAVERYLVNIL